MKGSENLWNEDELLAQLEEMQDQIDSLLKEKDDLTREAKEKDKQLQDQEQMSSSERSKLQSALQQAQKKMQEQSEQIVKLSEADLILKDNEKLKEENAKLQSAKEKSEKEAARVEEACEARLQRKDWLMQKKRQEVEAEKAAVKRKEEMADQLIRDMERLIDERVESKELKIRKECDESNDRIVTMLVNSHKREKHALMLQMVMTGICAMIATVMTVLLSEAYKAALKAAGLQIRDVITLCWTKLSDMADTAAGISKMIPVPMIRTVVYWAIRGGIKGLCLIAAAAGIFYLIMQIRKSASVNKIWPICLMFGSIICITAFFSESLQRISPVNIIYVDMLLWAAGSMGWILIKR